MGAGSMPCPRSGVRCQMIAAVWCFSLVVAPAWSVTNSGDVNVLHKLQQVWGEDTLLWSGTSDPCLDRWTGVTCDTNNTRVTSLYLVKKGLVGDIPAELGPLSALQNLNLSFNGLTGQLPTEPGSLTSLVYLSVQSRNISGPIPASLGKLVNLTFFALNINQLDGPISSSLGVLTKLKWFDVAYNSLTGPLPVSTTSPDKLGLDTWPVIEHFHLSDNAFSGPIPPELGLATNCVHMLLEGNSFTGSIPETFGNLSSLQILNLDYNQLTGSIPTTLNNIIRVGTTYAGLQQIVPLIVTLQVRAPTFTQINDATLWESFKNETYDLLTTLTTQHNPPLKLESSQIWVPDASYNGTLLSRQVRVLFFPLTNEPALDQTTGDFIKTSFTTQKVKYSIPFKPGLVVNIAWTLLGLILGSGGTSWRVIDGSAVGSVAAYVGWYVPCIVFFGDDD